MTTWGVVSTIRASTHEVLEFCAHHLELGADHLFIYLDDANQDTARVLENHPKITVTLCDAAYWEKRGKHPQMHQPRQSMNARHAIHRRQAPDWLAHIDVDEFLRTARPINQVLAELPTDTLVARIRPIEAICNPDESFPTLYKSLNAKADWEDLSLAISPTYGHHLNGGYLSHTMGKTFFRTLKGLSPRIHHVYKGDEAIPTTSPLSDIQLCHLHTRSWSNWIKHYRYRLEKGSYRPSLKGSKSFRAIGLNMNMLLASIEEEQGEAGLRSFFDEVCTVNDRMLKALTDRGLLIEHDLKLEAKIAKHFP